MTNDFLEYEYLFTKNIPQNILPRLTLGTYNRGDIILKQDTPAKIVYCLCEGRLRVFNENEDGEENRIIWIYPGDTVGELECLAELKMSSFTTEVFEDNTKVMEIKRNDFIEWLKQDHDFCFRVAQILAKKLYNTSKEFSASFTNDSATIVRRFIVELISKKIEENNQVPLLYTRADIAHICGVSERTVNRTIKKLKDQNLISLTRGKIWVNYQQYKGLMDYGKDEEV